MRSSGSLTWMHMIVRSLFGIGEAGNFPASIKTVAEWFPKRERALATGIFNSGANVGAMISALVCALVPDPFRRPTGLENGLHPHRRRRLYLADLLVLALRAAQPNKRISKAEYEYIHSDRDESKRLPRWRDDKSGRQSLRLAHFVPGRMSAAAFVGITSMIIFLCRLFILFRPCFRA